MEEDAEHGLGIFRRVIVEHPYLNDTVEYEAIDGSDYRVFMVPEWEEWVIGEYHFRIAYNVMLT